MPSYTVIGVVVITIICLLLGYEFVSFDNKAFDSDDEYKSARSDDAILAAINKLEEKISKQGHDLEARINTIDTSHDQLSVEPAVTETEHETLVDQACDHASEVEANLELKPWKKVPLRDRIGQFGQDKCEKVDKIYFLKTSKTGSTTMANILMRFGFRRENTNFLMGETPNGALFFINGYMPFSEEVCFLGRDINPKPTFDISYVHMRYNRTAIDRLMHPNTRKVSILRDPVSNFMSSWKYYHGQTKEMRLLLDIPPIDGNEKTPDFIPEMEKFLKSPWKYLEPWPYSHSAYLFTVNPQLIFFGQPSYLLRNTENRLWNLVDQWIRAIDADFDHILILEEVDDSLAVLMLKFCWDIDDVVHLKLNAMSAKSKEINAEAKRNLRELNWADYRLYNYFKAKLHKEIGIIGRARVDQAKKDILDRTTQLTEECIQPSKTTGWISNPKLKPSHARNQTCNLIIKDISNHLQAEQIHRWKKEYPDWRMPEEKMTKKEVKGKEMPNFCGPNENFQEWLKKQEPMTTQFLKWETNKYDTRNFIPSYMNNYLDSDIKDKVFNLV